MVAAVVAELEFESFPAERDSNQLMPQTNAKDGLAPHEPPYRIHGISTRLRIARTIRQKHSVRLQSQHVLRQSLRRHYRHPASLAAQFTQNILLNSKIISHYMKARRFILYSHHRDRFMRTLAYFPNIRPLCAHNLR